MVKCITNIFNLISLQRYFKNCFKTSWEDSKKNAVEIDTYFNNEAKKQIQKCSKKQ